MSGVLAFLAGAGQGYLKQSEIEEDRKLRQKDQAWQDESRNRTRAQWADEDRLQGDLRNAGAPAEVVAGPLGDQSQGPPVPFAGTPGETPAQFRVVAHGGVNQTFDTQDAAKAAQAEYGAPGAVQQRRIMALEQNGQFDKAGQAREAQGKLAEQARKYAEEGYSDALAKLRAGDGAGAAAAFNRSGQLKVQGDVSITPKEIDVPGVGKIKSYDATFQVIGPDGKPREVTLNSHDASMASMGYEKQLELQRKGSDSEAKANQMIANLENAGKRLELQGKMTEANIALREAQALRASALASGGAGGGGRGTPADERERKEARISITAEMGSLTRQIHEKQLALGDRMHWTGPDGQERKAAMKEEVNKLTSRRDVLQGDLGGITDAAQDRRGGRAIASEVGGGTSNKTAAAKPEQPAKAAAPKAGAVQGGYRFKGGNPADKNNWEKV